MLASIVDRDASLDWRTTWRETSSTPLLGTAPIRTYYEL
jgi:hypothetical protein